MKILVLNLQGAKPDTLFTEARLENIRRLMELGCFGSLTGDTAAWPILARQEDHILTLTEFLEQADKQCASFDDFSALRSKLESGDWDYCQLTVHGRQTASDSAQSGPTDENIRIDRELGEMLQHLGDDTIIAVLGEGCFVLVSGNNPLNGEHQGGSTADLAPTLLELAGYPLPSETLGKSWVAGMDLNASSSGLTAEEEEMLRERLSGLGYI